MNLDEPGILTINLIWELVVPTISLIHVSCFVLRMERVLAVKGLFILMNYFDISQFSFDGSIFYNQASSNYGHHRSSLAKTSDGAPLIVGAERPLSNKAEIMDIASNTWTEIAEYPYHDE